MTNLDFIPTSATGSAEEVYLPAKQVMRRYGDRSAMWLWRILRGSGLPQAYRN